MDDYPTELAAASSSETVEQEDGLQFFCKLTFGQFFTLVVLLVMTLCFSFYLGARYGNQYLRMGESRVPRVAVTSVMQPGTTTGAPLPEVVQTARSARGTWGASGTDPEDERIKQLAREALQSQQRNKLEGQVQDMLAAPTPPRPTTTSIAPPPEETQPTTMGAEHANTAPPDEPAVASGPAPAIEKPFPSTAAVAAPGAMTAARDAMPPVEPTGPANAPATMPPTPEEAPTGLVKVKSAGGMQYSVQIGAYQDQREATYFVEEWKTKGYPAYMMIANLGDRGQWYRVRLGGFPTKGDAEQYLNDLKTKEPVNGIVVFNEQ